MYFRLILIIIFLASNLIGYSQDSFQKLRNGYPFKEIHDNDDKERKRLFEEVLKGDWPKLINRREYINTCSIRMSVALNSLGGKYRIGSGYPSNHFDGNKNRILVSVPDIESHLTKVLGDPWGMSKQPGKAFSFDQLPKEKGIILYKFNLPHVNGHVDLWENTKCLHDCPEIDVNLAVEIMFWKI